MSGRADRNECRRSAAGVRFSRTAACLILGAVLVVAASPAAPQDPDLELVDRVLAVVDGDPILLSDLRQVVDLGLVERYAGESEHQFERRALDALIDQKLRFHEIERFGFSEVPVAEVERRFEEIRQRFSSQAAFEERLGSLSLDPQRLRHLIAHQLTVYSYVDTRLGARVFVGLDDIREYYDTVLVPEMESVGSPTPPLEEVREDIRAVLREQRLNEELERWTARLRREADIEDFFEQEPEPLPPVRVVIGQEAG